MGAIPWATQFQNGDTGAKTLMLDFDGLGHMLQPSAAKSLRALANEFESVFGVSFTISEAFRDLPTQRYFYDLYRRGIGNPAAVPGTSSHGQGLAVDINSWVYGNSSGTERHRWLVDNAPRFGWSWELVGRPSGEPWHFNYVGGWADWASTDVTPFETPEQAEERELMGAKDDIFERMAADKKEILEAIKRAGSRGGSVVYWVKDWGRTYSVGDNLIIHHRNDTEYQLALQESGQQEELAIETDSFRLVRLFVLNGLGEFVPGDQPDIIKRAPAGQVFTRGVPVTW